MHTGKTDVKRIQTSKLNDFTIFVKHDNIQCTLCQSDEIGDEFHYLMSCPNNEFVKLRNTFVTDICKINSSFRSIDTKNLFLYILNVHDKSIMKIISIYFHDTLAMYDSLL